MKKHTNAVFAAILVLAAAVSQPPVADSQELGPGRWVHIRKQAPQTNIESIFTDSAGNVWVGAGSNIHEYDGVAWKRFDLADKGLNNQSPFFIDGNDRLYIIDGGELVIWDGERVERFTGTKVGHPVVAADAGDGTVFLGSYSTTSGGLFVFDGDSVEKIMDGRVRSVTVDGDGTVWATVLDGETKRMKLLALDGGEAADRTAEVQDVFPVRTNELTVQTAPDGAVWVGNVGKYGVYRDGSWSFGDGGGAPVFIRFDRSGGAWGYGYKKLYRLDSDGVWKEMFAMVSGTTNAPNFMASGTDGSVWTFDAERVFRFDGNQWEEIVSSADLSTDMVTTLEYTGDGRLILGHGVRGLGYNDRNHDGISIRSHGAWEHYREFGDVDLLDVYQLKRTPDGDVMAYTDGGFKFFAVNKWIKVDSLFVNNQIDMTWDDEIMWITTERGLIEYVEGPEFDFYLPMDGDIAYRLDNIFLAADGALYMQTPKRDIVSYDTTEWRTVVHDTGFTNDFIIDGDGTIWGARTTGLAYWGYDTTGYRWITVVEMDDCRFVEMDGEGRLWAAGYGNIGYYADGAWHAIPELSRYASDQIAFAPDGRIVLNLFDREREEFYGVFEYRPTTAVAETAGKPNAFMAAVSHPNPFNAATTISFELPAAARVTADIFSVTGQRIARLADRRFPAGWNSLMWRGDTGGRTMASSGVYFYRIQAGGRVASGKMLLLR